MVVYDWRDPAGTATLVKANQTTLWQMQTPAAPEGYHGFSHLVVRASPIGSTSRRRLPPVNAHDPHLPSPTPGPIHCRKPSKAPCKHRFCHPVGIGAGRQPHRYKLPATSCLLPDTPPLPCMFLLPSWLINRLCSGASDDHGSLTDKIFAKSLSFVQVAPLIPTSGGWALLGEL